jgi:hypothetical protein
VLDGLKGSGGADETVVEGLVRNVVLGRGAPTRGSARARPEHMLAAKKAAPCPDPTLFYFGPVIPHSRSSPIIVVEYLDEIHVQPYRSHFFL